MSRSPQMVRPMLELDTTENPFREEIVARPVAIKQGHVEISTRFGLGVEVDEDAVKKYLVKS